MEDMVFSGNFLHQLSSVYGFPLIPKTKWCLTVMIQILAELHIYTLEGN